VYKYSLAMAMQNQFSCHNIQSSSCNHVCVRACSVPSSTSINELCGDIGDLVAHLGAAVCKANISELK
jgi:hypothetical protein